MKSNTIHPDYDLLENKVGVVPEQNEYLMPFSYDTMREEMAYIDHSVEKADTMSSNNNSKILSDSFGQTKVFPEFIYNEDQNKSLYELIPGVPVDSYATTYSSPNEIPLRLSSPIHFNLSTSLPNPTIERLHSKKKSRTPQKTLHTTTSPPSSQYDYESTPPNPLCYDMPNKTSNSYVSRALSLSPVSSKTETILSKKKASPKPSVQNSGIKRPLNSFMLYRRDKQSSIPTNNHQSISRIIGEMWKRETIEEKERYAEMALRERERHAKEYPDYKFLPRKKKDKNLSGKSPRKRKIYDPVLEQGESKILRMMLNQISHKKSQSDPEPFKIGQSNYHWFTEDENKTTRKKELIGSPSDSTTAGSSDNQQLLQDTYKYPQPASMPLPIFPIKNKIDSAGIYGSLDAFISTYDNLADHEIHTLMNNYSISSANELWLGSPYSKSCTASPQKIPYNIKDINTFIGKNEVRNHSLLSVYDSNVLNDDITCVQNNMTGLWEDTIDFSSYPPPNSLDNQQDVLSRSSFGLMDSEHMNLTSRSEENNKKY